MAEIPLELIEETLETNVLAGLHLSQKFIRKFIDEKLAGKDCVYKLGSSASFRSWLRTLLHIKACASMRGRNA